MRRRLLGGDWFRKSGTREKNSAGRPSRIKCSATKSESRRRIFSNAIRTVGLREAGRRALVGACFGRGHPGGGGRGAAGGGDRGSGQGCRQVSRPIRWG